jgi:hypothetical protein
MLPHVVVAADTVFTLADRTEARARAPDPTTNALALDLDTSIDARLVSNGPRITYLVANQPRLTLLDYNGAASQGAVMDTLLAGLEWRSTQTRIRLDEAAAIGTQSTESLSALPPPGAQTPAGGQTQAPTITPVPPTTKVLLLASSVTTLSSSLSFKPWKLNLALSYQLSGGADAGAEAVVPFQHGPAEQATATYQFTGRARDRLMTIERGFEASFNNGMEDLSLGIEEQWRRNWTRTTEAWLDVGLAAVRERAGPTAPDKFASDVVAEAAVDQRFGHGKESGDLLVDVRLSPLLNPLTGQVDEQVLGTVSGRWSRRRMSVRLLLGAGGSVDQGTDVAAEQAIAEVGAAYSTGASFTVDAGIRAMYESQKSPGTAPDGSQGAVLDNTLKQVVLFVAVNLRALKLNL